MNTIFSFIKKYYNRIIPSRMTDGHESIIW
jgi:hypothetical protein